MKKYKFTGETKIVNGVTLHRIVAVCSFSNVKEGDLGGWIESEENLSHNGDCWVYDEATVYGNAFVCDNAKVHGNAEVYDYEVVCGDTEVHRNADMLNKV